MTPGDKVYHLDGRRICRVVFAGRSPDGTYIGRRMPGHRDIVQLYVNPDDLFADDDAARAELRTRVAAAIVKAEAALAKLRAFDFNQPVLDVSEPPRGAR